MFRKFLKNNFSNYKWCRRYLGGYWECWYIDICHSEIWFSVNQKFIFERYGFRPGCGFGVPYCEYYSIDFFGYRTDFKDDMKEEYKRKLKIKKILCLK